MKRRNYYVDAETGLVIREINYDDPSDAFADIRIISDWVELYSRYFGKHPLFTTYFQIGTFERMNWLGNKIHLPGVGEVEVKVYAIIYNGTIISTPGVFLRDDEAYINLGTKKAFVYKYPECLAALIRYFKSIGKRKVYYFHHGKIDRRLISKFLKRLVMNMPHQADMELWEVDL